VADVQIDNGEFTRIANILLEKTALLHLNGTQYAIILTVWRFTYGFQRCEHNLSVTFISNATGISTRGIKKELKVLIDRNILLVTKESTKADSRKLKFNKNYDAWKEGNILQKEQGNDSSPGEQLFPSQGNNTSPHQGNNSSPKKEKKENLKENNDAFFEMLWSLYPRKKGKGKVSKTQKGKLANIGIDEMTRAIDRYIAENKGTEEKYLQYGSTFFNSGYLDYLDKNYQQQGESTRQPVELNFVETDYLNQ
jgi:Bacteriophage replication protein O.